MFFRGPIDIDKEALLWVSSTIIDVAHRGKQCLLLLVGFLYQTDRLVRSSYIRQRIESQFDPGLNTRNHKQPTNESLLQIEGLYFAGSCKTFHKYKQFVKISLEVFRTNVMLIKIIKGMCLKKRNPSINVCVRNINLCIQYFYYQLNKENSEN